MKQKTLIAGLVIALLALDLAVTACDSDSPSGGELEFLIKADNTSRLLAGVLKPFGGDVPEIKGKINHLYDLRVIGSISKGKLRLNLPAAINDEALDYVQGDSGVKYGELNFTTGAHLVLSKNTGYDSTLIYFNQDVAGGIKKGWNFKYRREGSSLYAYTNDIQDLYAPSEGYIWLVYLLD
jgi:hypothetical protein